jgi:hypothetical protein
MVPRKQGSPMLAHRLPITSLIGGAEIGASPTTAEPGRYCHTSASRIEVSARASRRGSAQP